MHVYSILVVDQYFPDSTVPIGLHLDENLHWFHDTDHVALFDFLPYLHVGWLFRRRTSVPRTVQRGADDNRFIVDLKTLLSTKKYHVFEWGSTQARPSFPCTTIHFWHCCHVPVLSSSWSRLFTIILLWPVILVNLHLYCLSNHRIK